MQYCEEVNYYRRDSFWKGFFSDKPFIVQSRNAAELKAKLLQNSYPILFEGLHSCFYLTDDAFKQRCRLVRMHNNEAEYYLKLAHKEHRFFKRLYFYSEYRRLMRFEHVLEFADGILCISLTETNHYQKKFGRAKYAAPFHGNGTVQSKAGRGDYALYHGNLEVNENIEAVCFLAEEVFDDLPFRLIIAGHHPAEKIKAFAMACDRIELIADPGEEQLNDLIRNAHINVLPTFMETGVKLKLINALYKGRFCLVNNQMVNNTGLEKYCVISNDAIAMKQNINELFQKEFTAEEIILRKQIETEFSDLAEAEKIIALLPNS